MYFDSIQQLISMNGHGVYVWTAFSISIVVMVSLILQPLCQSKKEFNNIRLHIKLHQVNEAAMQQKDSDAPHS
jgi:heme exporter protein D